MGISWFQGKVEKQSIPPLKQVIRLLHEQNKRLSSHGLARNSLASFLVWDKLQMLLVYFLVFQCYVNWTVTRSLNREHLVARTLQRLSHIMQNLLLFSRLFSHCFRLFLLVSLPSVWDSQILLSHSKPTLHRWRNWSFVGPADYRKLRMLYVLPISPTSPQHLPTPAWLSIAAVSCRSK